MTVRAYAASVLQKKKTLWTNFLCMQLQKLFPMLLPEAFSGNLKPVCANESWSPASVQPLSAVVRGLGHSWSIPLCFHGSVWSLSAAAERSLLTGARPDRVNAEFTRLAIPPPARPPLLPARLLSSLSPLCVFFNRALLLTTPSPLPSLCVPPQRWHCRRFLWERRDLRWSESADVFPAPCEPHHHRRAEIGRTKSTSVTTCSIIHGPPAMCIPVFPPAGSVSSSPDLICPHACAQVYDGRSSLNETVDDNLQQLEAQYAEHADYLSIVQKLQGQLEELVRQMAEIPFWDNSYISLEEVAAKIELYDWYRWGSNISSPGSHSEKKKKSYRIIYNPSIPPRVSCLHPQQQCFEAPPL